MAINSELVRVALQRVEGFNFERFVNEFMPSLTGIEFVPLGGVADGGADAFAGDRVYEQTGNTRVFYQASVQADVRAKVRHTVKRLREFGRDPQRLTLVTSQVLKHIDRMEDELSSDLDVTIRVRDAIYLGSNINATRATEQAYVTHLDHLTSYLRHVGAAEQIGPSAHVQTPEAYVFLRQELDRRDGDSTLVEAVTDSLALWALEGTDPDAGRFMTAEEVRAKIIQELPSARDLVAPRIARRLEVLASKDRASGRAVRWHKRDQKFCLPYETRDRLLEENLEDEVLRSRVLSGFSDRAAELDGHNLADDQHARIAKLVLRSFQLLFESNGLEFSRFLSGTEDETAPEGADAVRRALDEDAVAGPNAGPIGSLTLRVMRQSLYSTSEAERVYLGKLARTYALFFTLRTDAKVVKYFQDMGSDFYLYVGSDMLIKAMSERYLAPADQIYRNTLLIAKRGGAKLILAEPVLEEVITHLQATNYEYRNHYMAIEQRVTELMAANCSKILLRAYFYSKLEGSGVQSWGSFVDQFCDYASLHTGEGEVSLRRYLVSTFDMEYRTKDELRDLADVALVEDLAGRLGRRKDSRLADNDALLACAVLGRRAHKREDVKTSEFGYRTWWLTQETAILKDYRRVEGSTGERFVMRPDFLLNYFALAPSMADVRTAFANVFPAALGMQLSKRMDEDAFHQMLDTVAEAESYEPGRRQSVMAGLADKLKSDLDKKYDREFGSGSRRLRS